MKNTRSTIVLGALALALGLTGCGRAPAEASGQSDYFRALDSNHDGEVDRYEWENVRGGVFPDTLSFRYADCDANGRLSWREYATGYMSTVRCPTRYLYEDTRYEDVSDASTSEAGSEVASSTHVDDAQSEDWETGPLVARPEEPLQISNARPGDDAQVSIEARSLVLREPAPPRAGRHSETDLTPDELKRVRFSSQPLTDTILVPQYDLRENFTGDQLRRVFPLVVCKLANDNADLRITLADLQVVWRTRGREYRTRVLKTAWTNPGAAQLYHVWFRTSVDSAECRLLHARGQPAR